MFIYQKTSNFIQFRRISYKSIGTWYSNLVKPKPPNPPYRHIVQIGDPILRAVADEVSLNRLKSPEMKFLISQMRDVFKTFKCAGLSAPQIGVPLRVIMFEFSETQASCYTPLEFNNKEMSLKPLTVIINPQLKITDYSKVTFAESCESVKGFFADVPRVRGIEIKGYDENGDDFQMETSGWLARIIQHEFDHINGKIYTDLMDRRTLTCSCWEVINERRGKVELPYGNI